MSLRGARRVRVHLFKDGMPSFEGLLLSRRHGEYVLAVPELVPTAEGENVQLGSQIALIPRENVAFLEVLGPKGRG